MAAAGDATLVVLGDAHTGKSALVAALAAPHTPPPHAAAAAAAAALDYAAVDLGRGAAALDAPRCTTHLYTLHTADDAVAAALPYAFPPVDDGRASLDTLRDALLVVVLDWRTPWAFAAQLARWLPRLHTLVGDATSAASDADRAAMRDARAAALGGAHGVGAGVLDDDLGVPLVVVLTHADAIQALLDDRRVSEAQLDYAQQVVRTVAARYGAAVVSTSTARPASLDALAQCVRHMLHGVPGMPDAAPNDAAALVVPPGWDSWSKIRVLDAAFDCAAVGGAWARVAAGEAADAFVDAYAQVLPAPPDDVRGSPPVTVADEQAFLAQLYAQQQALGDAPTADAAPPDVPRNVLGPPVGASTLDMPAVVEALAAQQHADVREERAPPPAADTPRRVRPAPGGAEARTPGTPGTPGAATTPKQTEVLHTVRATD
ncbi:hypothetical protein MOBT1_002439 [Malassezia obtusa]|uniref:Dynein light intermediate chain n=1 Tax=Malassezia obtusa TaxID=76774 RepID=A0AAF0E2C6_9BASI|nr:hypothetical protein MOBT1_002439 [Malassezia obtusa]